MHLILFARAGELLLGLAEQAESAKEGHDMQEQFTRYKLWGEQDVWEQGEKVNAGCTRTTTLLILVTGCDNTRRASAIKYGASAAVTVTNSGLTI